MAGPLTIDASVFGRAAVPGEADSLESERLLRLLGVKPQPVFVPTLVKAEVASAVRRGTGSATLALEVSRRLEQIPGLTFVPIDDALADEAVEIILATALGGADSVYVAVARRYDAILVTLDNEQKNRTPEGVRALTPGQLLEELNV
jgi:predicted nucleic acid-binding protein